MDYITVRQASEKWGVTMRQIQRYLKDNRIPGAIQPGHDWLIPKDAEKPADGRVNNRRKPKKETVANIQISTNEQEAGGDGKPKY